MTKKPQALTSQDAALINRLLAAFEQARQVDERGREYWLAREYAEILGYKWQSFEDVIERAQAALTTEGMPVEDHFTHVRKLITAGKGAERDIGDIELTRRACYLVGVNGDPRKKESIAAVQSYFVEQTRKQEIAEILEVAGSDRDRLDACKKLEATEQELKRVVSPRVSRPDEHFSQIKVRGQKALFNKSPEKVKDDLGIEPEREIADFADPVIVKGMDFASALTSRQVREDEKLKGVNKIGAAHEKNNLGVRQVMIGGGAAPETIPPAGDIRDVQHRLEKQRAKLVKRTAAT